MLNEENGFPVPPEPPHTAWAGPTGPRSPDNLVFPGPSHPEQGPGGSFSVTNQPVRPALSLGLLPRSMSKGELGSETVPNAFAQGSLPSAWPLLHFQATVGPGSLAPGPACHHSGGPESRFAEAHLMMLEEQKMG